MNQVIISLSNRRAMIAQQKLIPLILQETEKLAIPPVSDPRSVSIVHFNARSVGSKWDEICADMQAIDADIYCISETWIKSPEDFALFFL